MSKIEGNRVFLLRDDGKERVRDKNKLKKVVPRPSYLQTKPSKTKYIYTMNDEFPPPQTTVLEVETVQDTGITIDPITPEPLQLEVEDFIKVGPQRVRNLPNLV